MLHNFSQLSLDEDLDEFLPNPSPTSRYLRDLVKQLYINQIKLFDNMNLVGEVLAQLKLMWYIKLSHPQIFNRLKRVSESHLCGEDNTSFSSLINEFIAVQTNIIRNNIALSYFYGMHKKEIEKNIFHAPCLLEEESMWGLRDLSAGMITATCYKNQFGHYSNSNYELAERRFSEYGDDELKTIGNFFGKDVVRRPHTHRSNYFQQFCVNPINDQDIYRNLLLIRDLSKDVSVRIIASLRHKILSISTQKRIHQPFNNHLEYFLHMGNK